MSILNSGYVDGRKLFSKSFNIYVTKKNNKGIEW
jgi:hypothetical protein